MKEIKLLSKGLFESKLLDSKATTRSVSKKEKIWGHLIGPLGLIFVVNTIAALVEKFFTQQVGAMYGETNIEMVQAMGDKYAAVMTIAKVLSMLLSLLNGWLTQHTQSRQGRMRPWYLIFGFISIAIGMTIFLFPGNVLGENYWYYFFILLIAYTTVGSTYFHLFREAIVSLTTRDAKEKMQVKFMRQLCWTLISGILIGMLVSMVVLPMWLEQDINGYPILMIILSIVAIPLLLLEYYYTRERVIEDVKFVSKEQKVSIPLKEQMKALFTNKFYVLLLILTIVGGIIDNFKGGNVQYFYIKFMLGGAEDWSMYTVYQVVTGIPLGIGAFAIYPLAKKFGVKNVSVVGYALVFVGSLMGWMFPTNLPIVLVAGFITQMGMLPHAYIFATLILYVYDSIEHKSGYRLEGLLGLAIVAAVCAFIYAPFAGGYESSILKLGFVDAKGVIPSQEVKDFMTSSFFVTDMIKALASLIILPFITVEKDLPKITADLKERKRQKMIENGEEWLDDDELAAREAEEQKIIAEENRIHDLRVKCEKKGLDFDAENAKYFAKLAEKEEKARVKAEKKSKK